MMSPPEVDYNWLNDEANGLRRSPSPNLFDLDVPEEDLIYRDISESPTPPPSSSDIPSIFEESPPKPFVLRRQHSRGALVAKIPSIPNLLGTLGGIPEQTSPSKTLAPAAESPIRTPPAIPLPSPPSSEPSIPRTLNLPAQVIQCIAWHLPLYPDRVHCTLVAKSWSRPAAKALYRCPEITRVEQFHALVQTLLNPGTHNYAAYIVSLNIPISISDQLLMGDLDIVLQLCSNLRGLRLENGLNVSNVLIQSLADNARHLRRLFLRGCPITDVLMQTLVKRCPRLEHVDLSYTQVTIGTLQTLIDGCERIRTIELESCGPNLKPIVNDPARSTKRDLRYLNLRNSGAADIHARYTIERCAGLESVVLDGCTAVTDDTIVKLAYSCGSTLRKLDCSFCPGVTNLGLLALSQHAKKMETLVLSGCERISVDGIQAIAKLQTLNQVELHGCSGILGTFVAKYAQQDNELECLLNDMAIRRVAEHKEEEARLVTREASTVTDVAILEKIRDADVELKAVSTVHQTTQTAFQSAKAQEDQPVKAQEKAPEGTADATTSQTATAALGKDASATEILLKFAEAIASGRWTPPGFAASGADSTPAPGWPAMPPGVPPYPYWAAWAQQQMPPPGWGYPPPGWPGHPGAGPFTDNPMTESPIPHDWLLKRQSSTETLGSELSKRTSLLSNDSMSSFDGKGKGKYGMPVMKENSATPSGSPPRTDGKEAEKGKRESVTSSSSASSSTGVSRLRPPSSLSRLPGASRTAPTKLKVPSAVTRGVRAETSATPTKFGKIGTGLSTRGTLSAGRTTTGSLTGGTKTPISSSKRETTASLSTSSTRTSTTTSTPTTYKPRQFRKFNSSPDEVPSLSSRRAVATGKTSTTSSTPTTPQPKRKPSTATLKSPPTSRISTANKEADRDRTKTLLSQIRAPGTTTRLRWSHHLQPSSDGEGWITGGTDVKAEDENNGDSGIESGGSSTASGSTASAPIMTPLRKKTTSLPTGIPTPGSGLRPPSSSGLRMPTPVKKVMKKV